MNGELKKRIQDNRILQQEIDMIKLRPRYLLLEVSNACNDKCIFCANQKMTRKRKSMDYDIGKKALIDGAEWGITEVGFYATGEPLLNANLESLISLAKNNGYSYTYLTTNGALLNEERAEKLVSAGIDSIKFSVNASNNIDYLFIHGKDDFDQVIDNIKKTKEICIRRGSKTKLYVSCVMTRQTKDKCKQLQDILGEFVDEIVYQPAVNFSGCMREIGEYLSIDGKGEYKPMSGICPYPFSHAIVTCEGYLSLCCLDYQNYLAVADLHECSLKEAWECKIAENMRKNILDDTVDGTLCDNCLRNRSNNISPLRRDLCTEVSMEEWGMKCELVTERIAEWEKTSKKHN